MSLCVSTCCQRLLDLRSNHRVSPKTLSKQVSLAGNSLPNPLSCGLSLSGVSSSFTPSRVYFQSILLEPPSASFLHDLMTRGRVRPSRDRRGSPERT